MDSLVKGPLPTSVMMSGRKHMLKPLPVLPGILGERMDVTPLPLINTR